MQRKPLQVLGKGEWLLKNGYCSVVLDTSMVWISIVVL